VSRRVASQQINNRPKLKEYLYAGRGGEEHPDGDQEVPVDAGQPGGNGGDVGVLEVPLRRGEGGLQDHRAPAVGVVLCGR
jgi:hypothetical protein